MPRDTARPDGTPGRILEHLKRSGEASIPDLARTFGLSPETVRAHMKALAEDAWVEDSGTRSEGRGRPERLWALTRAAESLFPRREAEVLQGFAAYLREVGREDLLVAFLDRFAGERRATALTRLKGLEGRARLDEVALILSDEGYMAEIVDGPDGGLPRLRLCHCPVRELVEVTRAPCRAEVTFVRELVGDTLARVEYIPDGGAACAYAVGEAKGGAAHPTASLEVPR